MKNLQTKIATGISTFALSAGVFASEPTANFGENIDLSSATSGIEAAGLAVLGLVLVVVGVKVVIKMVKGGASA